MAGILTFRGVHTQAGEKSVSFVKTICSFVEISDFCAMIIISRNETDFLQSLVENSWIFFFLILEKISLILIRATLR